MSTFDDRLKPAEKWEQELLLRLRGRGWLAESFGQAQITKELRDRLHAWSDDYGNPTRLRWMPDIIAAGLSPDLRIYLIDAKTERERYEHGENYSVEVEAVETGLIFTNFLRIPVLYVWPDNRFLTPYTVQNRWFSKRDGTGTDGSKTAFYLIKKAFAADVRPMFPPIAKAG